VLAINSIAMRITGGIARGQQLKLPKNFVIRPTTDRIREAVFSILASMDSGWSHGLDLYAGTGALGIEALSRDIGWVDFVDQEPRCCAIMKQNLEKTGLAQRAHINCCSVSKALTILNNKYDIIFIDPPYSDSSIESLVGILGNSEYMNDKSLVVIPHTTRLSLSEKYGNLALAKEKRHGDTFISIYRREV